MIMKSNTLNTYMHVIIQFWHSMQGLIINSIRQTLFFNLLTLCLCIGTCICPFK